MEIEFDFPGRDNKRRERVQIDLSDIYPDETIKPKIPEPKLEDCIKEGATDVGDLDEGPGPEEEEFLPDSTPLESEAPLTMLREIEDCFDGLVEALRGMWRRLERAEEIPESEPMRADFLEIRRLLLYALIPYSDQVNKIFERLISDGTTEEKPVG